MKLRRSTIQPGLTAIALAGLILAGCSTDSENVGSPNASAPAEIDKRPNILLIVADDLGYTDLGSFGGEIPTPNLDKLAYAGIRLANFHAAPVCGPARAMLLSGMDNHEAGVGSLDLMRFFDNGREPPKDVPGYGTRQYQGYLSARVAALPEVLRDAGYHTYMAGKWDLGRALVEEHIPAGRGFESSYAQLTGTSHHLTTPDGAADGGMPRADPLVFRENWEPVRELPPDYYSTKMFSDKLIEFIGADAGDEQPFFAYFPLSAPHFPLQAPEDWRDRFVGNYDVGYDVIRNRRVASATDLGILPESITMDNFPRRSMAWDTLDDELRADRKRRMEIYAAMVSNLDFHVGRIIGYLEASGELDNTFIIFMSDNGAEADLPPNLDTGYENSLEDLGTRNSYVSLEFGWAEATMAPFRDVKTSMAEGGVRAAAFARYPDQQNAGSISHEYLTMQDVMPTLLELAGVEHPGEGYNNRPTMPMRGTSFLSHLADNRQPVHGPDEDIGWELHGQRALVRGDWKLLSTSSAGEPVWQLYNLADDPGERTDLSDERSDLREELITAWYAYAEDVGVALE